MRHLRVFYKTYVGVNTKMEKTAPRLIVYSSIKKVNKSLIY